MKRYRLLKDLPFAKAGTIFVRHPEEPILIYKNHKIHLLDINADEWFEEAEELKKYYYIGSMGHVENTEYKGWELSVRLRKMMGNYFETYEETERHIDYLLAKEVIKQDTKGFKPEWNNNGEGRYCGFWDYDDNKPDWKYGLNTPKEPNIYFKSRKDILESFKKHPKEWKTYLTYEQ